MPAWSEPMVTGVRIGKMGMLKRGKRFLDEEVAENAQMQGMAMEDSLSDESPSSSSDSDEDIISSSTQNSAKAEASRPTKVMILASRGINARQRHLLDNLCLLMPHLKKESKFDTKKDLFALNELAELNGCNHIVFFEARKPQELFMWLAKSPGGPSVRFHVQNIHTLEELHLSGNCMKNTRAILTFDPFFSSTAYGQVVKDLLTAIFGVPQTHKKARPYIDHVIHFAWSDDRVWVRNYQIIEGASVDPVASDMQLTKDGLSLEEIGPRFVLHPIFIKEGSFMGKISWRNPHYVPLAQLRSSSKLGEATRHRQRILEQAASSYRKKKAVLQEDELDHVFD